MQASLPKSKQRVGNDLADQFANGGAEIDAIAFNRDELPRRQSGGSDGLYRMAYRLDVNEFRGRRKLQLVVEHIQSD